jgi:hypothetical protein
MQQYDRTTYKTNKDLVNYILNNTHKMKQGIIKSISEDKKSADVDFCIELNKNNEKTSFSVFTYRFLDKLFENAPIKFNYHVNKKVVVCFFDDNCEHLLNNSKNSIQYDQTAYKHSLSNGYILYPVSDSKVNIDFEDNKITIKTENAEISINEEGKIILKNEQIDLASIIENIIKNLNLLKITSPVGLCTIETTELETKTKGDIEKLLK